jgi:hypothetical protein
LPVADLPGTDLSAGTSSGAGARGSWWLSDDIKYDLFDGNQYQLMPSLIPIGPDARTLAGYPGMLKKMTGGA